jgi:hypothetical protein
MSDFDDELHSTLYPVWFNTYRVRTALELYEGVSTHADELQNHSHFFGLIQNISLDYAALGICRMFDKSSTRYRRDTIFATFEFLKVNLTSTYTRRVKSDNLIRMGIASNISLNMNAKLIEDFESHKNVLLDEIAHSMPSIKNNESLEKLFTYRDKVLAHQERLTDDLKDKLKFLPSLGHMEDINRWVENFCALSMSLLSNTTLLPPSFSARIAALNVIAKLLDKDFLPGSNEYHEFYKKIPD